MRPPVACTLSDGEARSQLAEWRDLLAAEALGVHRASTTELVFQLHDDLGRLPTIVDLVRREKLCCQFFDFAIGIEAEFVTLRITGPPEAGPILDHFEGLLNH